MDRFAALPGFVMPTQGRDPDLLHVQQLEAVMEWIECNMLNEKPQMEIANAATMMRSMEAVTIPAANIHTFDVGVNEGVTEPVMMPEPTPPSPRGKGKRK